ncbi:hypothetical protein [Streptomyces avermitilis]|uniref:hypothetical protein n=1 Tax=Streptomyces avermitilis TaxID=33903 RepID=UPI0038298035
MSCAADSAPPMLAEFLALPTRAHSLLWYGIVDGEPRADTAGFLDITTQDVSYGSEGAFQTLRHSVLKTRLAGSEEAVHPDSPAAARTWTPTWHSARNCATARFGRARRRVGTPGGVSAHVAPDDGRDEQRRKARTGPA